MSTTKRLRLGPLPRLEFTKLTFACPANLKTQLDRYAAVHSREFGESVDAVTLIPHMLAQFVGRDHAFKAAARRASSSE